MSIRSKIIGIVVLLVTVLSCASCSDGGAIAPGPSGDGDLTFTGC